MDRMLFELRSKWFGDFKQSLVSTDDAENSGGPNLAIFSRKHFKNPQNSSTVKLIYHCNQKLNF